MLNLFGDQSLPNPSGELTDEDRKMIASRLRPYTVSFILKNKTDGASTKLLGNLQKIHESGLNNPLAPRVIQKHLDDKTMHVVLSNFPHQFAIDIVKMMLSLISALDNVVDDVTIVAQDGFI